jgi:hypothetical protein
MPTPNLRSGAPGAAGLRPTMNPPGNYRSSQALGSSITSDSTAEAAPVSAA